MQPVLKRKGQDCMSLGFGIYSVVFSYSVPRSSSTALRCETSININCINGEEEIEKAELRWHIVRNGSDWRENNKSE